LHVVDWVFPAFALIARSAEDLDISPVVRPATSQRNNVVYVILLLDGALAASALALLCLEDIKHILFRVRSGRLPALRSLFVRHGSAFDRIVCVVSPMTFPHYFAVLITITCHPVYDRVSVLGVVFLSLRQNFMLGRFVLPLALK
jgi:hypothetical protein